MLVAMSVLLADAKDNAYAVGAFNTSNLEYVQAILESAEETRSPVIIQAAGSEIDYMGGHVFTDIVRRLSERMMVPVAIHLDHGSSYDLAIRCIHYGFTSVMFDGSRLPLEENIAVTRDVVRAAHAVGISVEGEIGIIGGASEIEGAGVQSKALSDPGQCEHFAKATGLDCLAVSIGTAHGLYRAKPKLDFDRLKAIVARTLVPIVLHGGTGVPQEDIRTAIHYGVAKINFSTIVRQACIQQLRRTLVEFPEELDLMAVMGKSKAVMKETIKQMMGMCGSVNRA